MTDADDIIRGLDIPERMQIAQAGLQTRQPPPPPQAAEGQPQPEPDASDTLLYMHELADAASWIAPRISPGLSDTFILTPTGEIPPLREAFVLAVQQVLHFLCVEYFEVPFIWHHRKDYLITMQSGSQKTEQLLWRDDLWRVYHLAIKYRAILDRKAHLSKLWQKLGEQNEYYSHLFNGLSSLDEAADLVEYVTIKYQKRLQEMAHQAGAELIPDNAEVDAVRSGIAGQKYKRATSDSTYAKAKASIVSRFADVGSLLPVIARNLSLFPLSKSPSVQNSLRRVLKLVQSKQRSQNLLRCRRISQRSTQIRQVTSRWRIWSSAAQRPS